MDLIFTTTAGKKILLEENRTETYCISRWYCFYSKLPEFEKCKGKSNVPGKFRKRKARVPVISSYDEFLRNN